MPTTQDLHPSVAPSRATDSGAIPVDVAPLSAASMQDGGHMALACGCVVCDQLAGTEDRYFGKLLRDGRSRQTLAQTIATSMGFCARHTVLASSSGAAKARAMRTAVDDAGRHLASLLDRSDLQDELIQDILFGARSRCPACAYFHRAEGRALARVLRAAEHAKRAVLPDFCFVHIQMLVQRTEPPLRGRLIRQLRLRAKAALAALPAEPVESDSTAAVRTVLYPLGGKVISNAIAQCPVCESIAMAGQQWLEAAAENVRLEQPGWITLPTCNEHLLQCLAHPSPDLRRAALDRYLEVALPGRSTQPSTSVDGEFPKRRRRSRTRWFDSAAATGTMTVSTALRERCPGCDAQEIAGRRAIASLIRKAARAGSDEAVTILTAGVCLKHFAEALIYASNPKVEQRLSHALCETLRVAPRDEAVGG
ncbi:hypothetical protein [Paraburkholderia tropica]|uniref:hypothetical protein n=1 Tax=Paraburkholderia tropica TaxID=92647 RepID=UPI002AB2AD5F|nr:hypothetical protein [Paraburkholderia tropica]